MNPNLFENFNQDGAYTNITLRDIFAAFALSGLVSDTGTTYDVDARRAYKAADTMLRQRYEGESEIDAPKD